MDAFIKKLKEYGLEALTTDDNRKVLRTIEDQIDTDSYPVGSYMHLQEIITYKIFVVVKHTKRFLEKAGIDGADVDIMQIVLSKMHLDFEPGENRVSFYQYNAERMDQLELITEHIQKNEAIYKTKHPEWKMKKMFEGEKATKELAQKLMLVEARTLERIEKSVLMEKIHDEMLATLEKMVADR